MYVIFRGGPLGISAYIVSILYVMMDKWPLRRNMKSWTQTSKMKPCDFPQRPRRFTRGMIGSWDNIFNSTTKHHFPPLCASLDLGAFVPLHSWYLRAFKFRSFVFTTYTPNVILTKFHCKPKNVRDKIDECKKSEEKKTWKESGRSKMEPRNKQKQKEANKRLICYAPHYVPNLWYNGVSKTRLQVLPKIPRCRALIFLFLVTPRFPL